MFELIVESKIRESNVIIDFGNDYRLFVEDDRKTVTLVCKQDADLNEILNLK